MKKNGLGLPLISAALLIRLFVAPVMHHGDADSFFYWGKYLWETKGFLFFLGRAIPNAMPATYPPIFYYMLFLWRGLYEIVQNLLWWLNVKISIFPSSIIPWFQSYEIGVAFNKLIAILFDLGCGWLIYKLATEITHKKKLARWCAAIFLIFPTSWYNSAYWGQNESICGFFILLCLYLLIKKYFLLGLFAFGVSILIKQTGIFLSPLIVFYFFKKKQSSALILGAACLIVLSLLLYSPFQPLNTIPQAIRLYAFSLKGEIQYLAANSFNFWTLIFGFDPLPDSVIFLGLQARTWGFLFYGVTFAFILKKLQRIFNNENFMKAALLLSLAAFLFLPRMHERYFYTALIFSAITACFGKKHFLFYLWFLVMHLTNLYHFWWRPEIKPAIVILSNQIVVNAIILANIAIFLFLLSEKWGKIIPKPFRAK